MCATSEVCQIPYTDATVIAEADHKNPRNLQKDAINPVRQLDRMSNLSLAHVHCSLKKNLKIRKINARWIPHLLSDEQKIVRVENAQKLLKLYSKYTKKTF